MFVAKDCLGIGNLVDFQNFIFFFWLNYYETKVCKLECLIWLESNSSDE